MLSELWIDLRFAWRSISRHRTFFGAVLLLLALALGTTTALFAVARAVQFRPLPYPRSEELSMIWTTRAEQDRFKASLPDFFDWRARATTIQNMAAVRGWLFSFTPPGKSPVGLSGLHVEGDLFGTFGIEPTHGRLLEPRDGRVGAPRVAVVSHALWRTAFGSDPALVGKPIVLDGEPHTVIGIAPQGFAFSSYPDHHAEVWVPMASGYPRYADTIASSRDSHESHVVARRKPSVTPAQTQAELSAIADAIAREHPEHRTGVRVTGLREELATTPPELMWSLFAAVTLVLLLVCSNFSSLLLSRNQARRAELALRAALGAARGRLARQLALETLLLFLLAAPLALGAAHFLVKLLYELAAQPLWAATLHVELDLTVLAFCAGSSLVCGVIFGTIPAVHATRTELSSLLKEGAAQASTSRAQKRVRATLVVVQVALAQALLVCSGLSIKTFTDQLQRPLGFDPKNIVVNVVLASGERYSELEKLENFYDELLRRIAARPGVEAVAANNTMPPYAYEAIYFEIEGKPSEQRPLFEQHDRITPDYFRTLRIPVLAGRHFSDADNRSSKPVLIVSQSASLRYFDGDPIGKRVRLHGKDEFHEIVGVVGDVQRRGVRHNTQLEAYLPFAQDPFRTMMVAVRSSDPDSVFRDFPKVVAEIDRTVPVVERWPMERDVTWYAIGRSLAPLVLAAFAVTALILAALGSYGLASHLSQQRSREIGIRMALGAPEGAVAWLVVKTGVAVVALGVGLGSLLALALVRVLTRYLPGAATFHAGWFALVPLILILSGGLACIIPAWRAVRASPATALRYE